MEPEGSLPHSQASVTFPVLCQPNPVHVPTSHLLEIHPNIIQPSTPRSPQWSLSLRFPHQDPIRPPLLTHTRHMPSPSHSSLFYHPHNIGWAVQIIQLHIGNYDILFRFCNYDVFISCYMYMRGQYIVRIYKSMFGVYVRCHVWLPIARVSFSLNFKHVLSS